jgi:hypothetical protein
VKEFEPPVQLLVDVIDLFVRLVAGESQLLRRYDRGTRAASSPLTGWLALYGSRVNLSKSLDMTVAMSSLQAQDLAYNGGPQCCRPRVVRQLPQEESRSLSSR